MPIYSIVAAKLESKQWMSILLYTILFVLNLCSIPLFYLTIQWESNFQLIGIGLGMLVSSLLTLLIAFLLNYKTINFRNEFKPTFVKNTFKFFFLKTSNFVFNFILSTVMKCFLLMILGLALKSYDKSTFTSLMMSKIIWYHSLYFCGFFADGLLYTIEYTKIQNFINKNGTHKQSLSLWLIFTFIAAIGTLLVCVVFNFIATNGLSYLYFQNQLEAIGNVPSDLISKPNQYVISNFLWSTSNVNIQLITGEMTPCFALMYLTIYHVFINSTKIISLKPIKVNQKFNWKTLISNIVLLIVVMAFISIMGCAFNDVKFAGYLNAFNGLDGFSFSLMLVAIILTAMTSLSLIKIKKISNFTITYPKLNYKVQHHIIKVEHFLICL